MHFISTVAMILGAGVVAGISLVGLLLPLVLLGLLVF